MAHPTKANYHATEQPTRNSRRNDRGLTTLEWLLIVAAVAGLAALAVVLVQNVVDDTAEQISGSSARLTAATVAAAEITSDAQESNPDYSALQAKCGRLRITYGDALDEGAHPKVPEWFNASSEPQLKNYTGTPTDPKKPKVDGTALTGVSAFTCLLVDKVQMP